MRRVKSILFLLAISGCAGPQSCSYGPTGRMSVSGTDAPVDDPFYSEVFFTIKDLQLNGESVEDFTGPITLNISELTNGITTELADAEVPTGEADEMVVVLGLEQDDSGNAPGCYVNTSYGRKIDLGTARGRELEVRLRKNLQIKENEPLNVVIDFDLRKSIRSAVPGDDSELSFVSDDDLSRAFRVVNEKETGTITGQLTNMIMNQELVNAFNIYAYRRGTFDKAREQYDSDGDGIAFEQAVTSTRIEAFGGETEPFSLHFLEAGEYDLVIEAYEFLEISSYPVGMLQPQGQSNLVIPIRVQAQQTSQLSVSGIAIVP